MNGEGVAKENSRRNSSSGKKVANDMTTQGKDSKDTVKRASDSRGLKDLIGFDHYSKGMIELINAENGE